MVYTSNADVLYGRKRNTYRGPPTRGVGYGYSKSGITSLLKAFTGNNKRVKLFPKKQSVARAKSRSGMRPGYQMRSGGNSISNCNFGTRKCFVPRSVLNAHAPQHRLSNSAISADATAGVQSYYEIPWLSGPIALAISSAVTDRVFFEKIAGEVQLVNASATNSSLIIYDIIARRDINTANKNNSPAGAWAYGIDNEGGSSSDYTVIGSTPLESEMFRNFYRIVQRTPISLAPGELHRHITSFTPNKLLSSTVSDCCTYGIGDLSCWTLIVHHGMPAHDSTTTTSVTIDPSTLDVVHFMTVDTRLLQKTDTVWTKSNNLSTSFAVGEEFVNKAQGLVQTVAGLDATQLHS